MVSSHIIMSATEVATLAGKRHHGNSPGSCDIMCMCGSKVFKSDVRESLFLHAFTILYRYGGSPETPAVGALILQSCQKKRCTRLCYSCYAGLQLQVGQRIAMAAQREKLSCRQGSD